MNNGIILLEKELKVLSKLGNGATVENYNPDRVEEGIRFCCKCYPRCQYQRKCRKLYDLWSGRAPIEYAPFTFEKLNRLREDSLSWMPKLRLSGRSILRLPLRGIEEIPTMRSCIIKNCLV